MRTFLAGIVLLLTTTLAAAGLTVPATAAGPVTGRTTAATPVATSAAMLPQSAFVAADKKKPTCKASWLAAYGCVMALVDAAGWIASSWGKSNKCVKRVWWVPINPSTGQPSGPQGWKCTKFVRR